MKNIICIEIDKNKTKRKILQIKLTLIHEYFHMLFWQRMTIKHGMYGTAMHTHVSVYISPMMMSGQNCVPAVNGANTFVVLFIVKIDFT